MTGDYTIDPVRSRLGFVVRHAVVTRVRGHFSRFAGEAHIDLEDPSASSTSLSIETTSISTGNVDRDTYLRSHDFFGSQSEPQIIFVSTRVTRERSAWTIAGDLTINGVTRRVRIPFRQTRSPHDPEGRRRVGFEGRTSINRSDWGLTFNAVLETGSVLVSERIDLELDVSAIQNT